MVRSSKRSGLEHGAIEANAADARLIDCGSTLPQS
jgi:hypothetical protein